MIETGTSKQLTIEIRLRSVTLEGDLVVPPGARGIVLFAHGSGSSRKSVRNRFVAGEIQKAGIATLLFDLLSEDEEAIDRYTRHIRFSIEMLGERLVGAIERVLAIPETRGLKVGLFGASTGAAAALIAAAQLPETVSCVVSRGGRPDLAARYLPLVRCPVLLIVGGRDNEVIELNKQAAGKLTCEKELVIIRGATHLFEEPGTLESAAETAAAFFRQNLS
ncbi:MAG TPA: hydrolase [Blastocatellia bacterium]|nr:hydrolase [Blastocatellia bacterium]